MNIKKNTKYLFLFIFALEIYYFMVSSFFDSRKAFVFLFLTWLLISLVFRIGPKLLYISSLICLILVSILVLLKESLIAEKIATWCYIFFITGIIYQLYFYVKKNHTV